MVEDDFDGKIFMKFSLAQKIDVFSSLQKVIAILQAFIDLRFSQWLKKVASKKITNLEALRNHQPGVIYKTPLKFNIIIYRCLLREICRSKNISQRYQK